MKPDKSHEVRKVQPAPACQRADDTWRYESPLEDRVPQNRLGQYVGPIPRDGQVYVANVRFRFLGIGEPDVSARLSVSCVKDNTTERAVFPGKLDSWTAEGLEIHMLVYLMSEKELRCSILVDKK